MLIFSSSIPEIYMMVIIHKFMASSTFIPVFQGLAFRMAILQAVWMLMRSALSCGYRYHADYMHKNSLTSSSSAFRMM